MGGDELKWCRYSLIRCFDWPKLQTAQMAARWMWLMNKHAAAWLANLITITRGSTDANKHEVAEKGQMRRRGWEIRTHL